jgi:hypothetical protein
MKAPVEIGSVEAGRPSRAGLDTRRNVFLHVYSANKQAVSGHTVGSMSVYCCDEINGIISFASNLGCPDLHLTSNASPAATAAKMSRIDKHYANSSV